MKVLEQLSQHRQFVLSQVTEWQGFDEDEVEAAMWFLFHLEQHLSQLGYVLRGHSFRYSDDEVLLVLKVSKDGTPLVVFRNSLTTTRCVQGLQRGLAAGTLVFYPDKYA